MKRLSSKWDIAGRRFYFLCYTLTFLLLSTVVFLPFILNHKSLIWKPDGLTQHFNSLVYFRNWALSMIHTLIAEHRLSIPLWDSYIGYGSDIVTTLHYYVIGDPLNFLSLFVPLRYLETLYNILILLRLYLAGIAFSCYCFRMKRESMATFAGSLIYVFCGYGLVLAPMHPYFINPMIYLPLLLIGIERVFHKEKGHLLVGMTALSALSNFYFFYMLVILTILYCVIRFCTMEHQNWKAELGSCLKRTLFFSINGALLSAVLLLPILLQLISDMRINTSLTYAPIYEWNYYKQFLDQFLSLNFSSNWTYLCFSTPSLLCVLLLFIKKKRFISLKIGFLILTGFLLVPAAGSFLNGFSYPANRWSFGYSFLIALIVTYLWPELFSLTSKEKYILSLLFLSYGLILFLLHTSSSTHTFFALFMVLLTLVFLSKTSSLKKLLSKAPKLFINPQFSLFFLIFINICANSIFFYQINPNNHLHRFVDTSEGLSSLEQSAAGMASLFLKDSSTFCRYAQDLVPVRNDTLSQKAHSIHYYWSLSNGSITQFFNELALPFKERAFKYDNLDNRAQLHALAGVRWYIQHDPNQYLPYPYTDTHVFDYLGELYYASQTEAYLPLGYTCASLIPQDIYQSLPYLQRQQALLQGIVIENLPAGFETPSLTFAEQQIPFQISHGTNIQELDGKYYTLADQAELTLSFDGIPSCETYLLIKGLDAQALTTREHHYLVGIPQYPITCTSEALDTNFSYYTRLTESSYDRSDFLINMGYTQNGQHTITLTLPYQGVYSFENLAIYCLPLQNLSEQIATLSQEHLENVSFTTNSITGTITVSDSKYLCLSIPYSKGWKAYVDGHPVPLCQANTMYMALPLESGTQSIELHYTTPGLIPGLLITTSGLIIWLLYFLFEHKKRSAPHAKEA